MERDWDEERPTNYDRDCKDRPRPCPWVGCKYHRFLDVNPVTGTISFNIGRTTVRAGSQGRPITVTPRMRSLGEKTKGRRNESFTDDVMEAFDRAEELDEPTCLLDVIGDGQEYTLEQIGDFFAVSRERIRQLEEKAFKRIRRLHGDNEELVEAAQAIGHDGGESNW